MVAVGMAARAALAGEDDPFDYLPRVMDNDGRRGM